LRFRAHSGRDVCGPGDEFCTFSTGVPQENATIKP
jgi:hypothetical protein